MLVTFIYEIWASHDGKNDGGSILCYNAMFTCGSYDVSVKHTASVLGNYPEDQNLSIFPLCFYSDVYRNNI